MSQQVCLCVSDRCNEGDTHRGGVVSESEATRETSGAEGAAVSEGSTRHAGLCYGG